MAKTTRAEAKAKKTKLDRQYDEWMNKHFPKIIKIANKNMRAAFETAYACGWAGGWDEGMEYGP